MDDSGTGESVPCSTTDDVRVRVVPSNDMAGGNTSIELSVHNDKPEPQPFVDALLDDYSDEELLHYIRQSPRLVTTVKQAVLILSPGLLAKAVGGTCYDDPMDEICAMQRARALGINVPAFRRLVPADDCGTHYLVMERVIGDTLEKRWRNLGLWGTLRAAWKLRGYLRLLRTVTAQTTGGLHSGRTRCPWLDDQRGPVCNASPVAFVGYLNWWLVDCRPQYCTPHPELVLKLAKEHILVHQDLAPRNMILDPRGTLWLVDWGISGFYPEYMEFLWDRRHIVVTLDVVVEGTHMGGMDTRKAFGAVSVRTQRFRLDKTPFSGEL